MVSHGRPRADGADGFFYYVDRLKDSIRRRGENVSSFDVEGVVNAFASVVESAAYGVPSELGEDDVMIAVSARGTLVVWGRSDATLNRGGVRLGSGEIYGAVERLPEVVDSLVIGVEEPDGGYYMPLFVVLAGEGVDEEALLGAIAAQSAASSPPATFPTRSSSHRPSRGR